MISREASLARAPGLALAGLSLAMLMSSLNTSITNAGLPTLAGAFGATFQQVQWVVLAYLLAITTLIVSLGQLGDRVGRRRLLLAGIALFTASSLLCGMASSLSVLVAMRALQGVGAAVMMALTMAIVGETVGKDKTGAAMGLLGTTSALGTALGPSLGGFLIAATGWKAIFLVNVPLGLAALLLVGRFLPADRGLHPEVEYKFDWLGTMLLTLTLGAYALAMTIWRGNLLLIGLAMVGAVLFVIVESVVERPLIKLAAFGDAVLSKSLILNLLVSTVMMSTLVVGPFYLSRALGLGEAIVGMLLSVGPAVVALSGVPAGGLADRFGAESVSRVGLGLMAVGSALLSLTATFGVAGYVGSISVLTLGYALFQTSNNAVVMGRGLAADRGVTSGLLNLSRNLGLVTGASAMGALFALASGSSDVASASPVAVSLGMQITFGVSAALIFGGVVMGWAWRERVPCASCAS